MWFRMAGYGRFRSQWVNHSASLHKNGSFIRQPNSQKQRSMRTVVYFNEVLAILLHRSVQTVSINLCTSKAWCTDVLEEKSHPQFDMKNLKKKVRPTHRCLLFA